MLSEIKDVVWPFHSDETLSDWWMTATREGSQKPKLPSNDDRFMASIMPTMALITESIVDISLAIGILPGLEGSISFLLALVSISCAIYSIVSQLWSCFVYRIVSCPRFHAVVGITFGALATDWADSAFLLAAGNSLNRDTLLATLLPLLLPAGEIGLALTWKRGHLISHTLFTQCVVSPLLVVSHAFVFELFEVFDATISSVTATDASNNSTVSEIFPVVNGTFSVVILGFGFLYYSYVSFVTSNAWEDYDFTSWHKKVTLQQWFSCVDKKETKTLLYNLVQVLHTLLLTTVGFLPILVSFIVFGLAEQLPSILFLAVLLLRAILIGVYIVSQIGIGRLLIPQTAKNSVSSIV